jgi:hypothetical protein
MSTMSYRYCVSKILVNNIYTDVEDTGKWAWTKSIYTMPIAICWKCTRSLTQLCQVKFYPRDAPRTMGSYPTPDIDSTILTQGPNGILSHAEAAQGDMKSWNNSCDARLGLHRDVDDLSIWLLGPDKTLLAIHLLCTHVSPSHGGR